MKTYLRLTYEIQAICWSFAAAGDVFREVGKKAAQYGCTAIQTGERLLLNFPDGTQAAAEEGDYICFRKSVGIWILSEEDFHKSYTTLESRVECGTASASPVHPEINLPDD